MMLASYGLATYPLAHPGPPAGPPVAFGYLALGSAAAQYLIEITGYIGGESRAGGIAGLAEIPLADQPKRVATTDGTQTLRYADKHWVGSPTDTGEPNRFYEGRATVPLIFERLAPLSPSDPRRVQRQFGSIEFANGDGRLDAVVDAYAIDGRQVRVLWGPEMGAYSSFQIIADLTAVSWDADETVVRLIVRDNSYVLEEPFQTTLYSGAGGAEGTAELAGKPKPKCYGRARNVPAVQVTPASLVYQVHDGAISAIDAVYDRGLALTFNGVDHATYAALIGASIAAGNYATAKAVGMFRLGSSPAGLIAADVRGDATTGYADTLDHIAFRLLSAAGVPGGEVREDGWTGAAVLGGELGFYVGPQETPTTAALLDRLVASVAGWWGAGRDGRLTAGRLVNPDGATPALYLDTINVLELFSEPRPTPIWRHSVHYQPIWATQRGEDLAGGVTADRRQYLAEPFRKVSASSATVVIRHIAAIASETETLLDTAAAAQTLADAMLALYSADRRIVRARTKRLGYMIELGYVVRLDWPRLGLTRNMTVVGIREDADRDETTLRLWG